MSKKMVVFSIVVLIVVATILIWKIFHPITSIEGIEGFSEEKIIGTFGQPDMQSVFAVSDSTIYEYRYGLFKYYPREESRSNDVTIKEYLWNKRNKTFVVWFHKQNDKWVVLDNLEWSEIINF